MVTLSEQEYRARYFEVNQKLERAQKVALALRIKNDKMQLIRDNDKGAILTLTKFIKKLKDMNEAVIDFDDIEELRNHIRRNSPI